MYLIFSPPNQKILYETLHYQSLLHDLPLPILSIDKSKGVGEGENDLLLSNPNKEQQHTHIKQYDTVVPVGTWLQVLRVDMYILKTVPGIQY